MRQRTTLGGALAPISASAAPSPSIAQPGTGTLAGGGDCFMRSVICVTSAGSMRTRTWSLIQFGAELEERPSSVHRISWKDIQNASARWRQLGPSAFNFAARPEWTGYSFLAVSPRTTQDPPRRATFGTGLLSVFRAFGHLGRLPQAWPYALVPTLVFALLATFGVWAAFEWLEPIVRGWLPTTTWYGRFGGSLVSYSGAFVGAVAAALVAMVMTPSMSAPALERIVALVERDLGVPPRRPIGWLAEVGCGLRALAAGAMFAVPIGALLFIVDLLIAPAAVVTVPLRIVLAALMVAWNLLDYPLTLRGMRVRERLALARAEWRSFFGFGLAFFAAFWIPCCGILLLPVGVVGATRLTSVWLAHNSERETPDGVG